MPETTHCGFQPSAQIDIVHVEYFDGDNLFTIIIKVHETTIFNAARGTIYEYRDRVFITLEPGYYWTESDSPTTPTDTYFEPDGPYNSIDDCMAEYS